MPGLPGDQRLAVDLDDAGMRAGLDLDHTQQLVGIGALDRGDRVVFQRPEHGGDRHLHLGAGLDTLKDDHSAIEEQPVELGTGRFVLQHIESDAGNARAEG